MAKGQTPEEIALVQTVQHLTYTVDLKIDNLRAEVHHNKELTDRVEKKVDGHEARIDTLEGKDLQQKAGRYDKAIKWAWGILLGGVGAWLLTNIGNILTWVGYVTPKVASQ